MYREVKIRAIKEVEMDDGKRGKGLMRYECRRLTVPLKVEVLKVCQEVGWT